MAKINQLDQAKRKERQLRIFSDEFKRRKVEEIEKNLVTVSELSREYEVSRVCIYKWIYKFSKMRKKEVKQVIETESDTRKAFHLQEDLVKLERALGKKQLEIDFLTAVLKQIEKDYKIDIKKKFFPKSSD
ncbi:MAG TPA: transposase [Stenomitos sp.]